MLYLAQGFYSNYILLRYIVWHPISPISQTFKIYIFRQDHLVILCIARLNTEYRLTHFYNSQHLTYHQNCSNFSENIILSNQISNRVKNELNLRQNLFLKDLYPIFFKTVLRQLHSFTEASKYNLCAIIIIYLTDM